jgi:hypothetical protein
VVADIQMDFPTWLRENLAEPKVIFQVRDMWEAFDNKRQALNLPDTTSDGETVLELVELTNPRHKPIVAYRFSIRFPDADVLAFFIKLNDAGKVYEVVRHGPDVVMGRVTSPN